MALVLGCRYNKCYAPAVCVCVCSLFVFVFVSHSFLYSHILSDAVSNHSTTCAVDGWNYPSPFVCSVCWFVHRLFANAVACAIVFAAIVPTENFSHRESRRIISPWYSHISKKFCWFSFRFRSLAPIPRQSDSSTMVCLLSLLLSSWDHSTFLHPFVCFSLDMCASKSLRVWVSNCAIFVHIYSPCHRHPSSKYSMIVNESESALNDENPNFPLYFRNLLIYLWYPESRKERKRKRTRQYTQPLLLLLSFSFQFDAIAVYRKHSTVMFSRERERCYNITLTLHFPSIHFSKLLSHFSL